MSLEKVDVVISAYNESSDMVALTVSSCLDQTYPPQNVYIVDDGSSPPLELPPGLRSKSNVHLLRIEPNKGISAARNTGISHSDADYIACTNIEVTLDHNWISTCLTYLKSNQSVGACCSRIRNKLEGHLLSKWKVRFLQKPYEHNEGSYEVESCTGHAVLFKREALEEVGGYNYRFSNTHEDADICFRLKENGYESHVVEGTRVTHLQDDTLALLASKTLRASGWALKPNYAGNPALRPVSFFPLALNQTYWLFHRIGRNLFKLRLSFILIDLAVWAHALQIGWKASKEFQSRGM